MQEVKVLKGRQGTAQSTHCTIFIFVAMSLFRKTLLACIVPPNSVKKINYQRIHATKCCIVIRDPTWKSEQLFESSTEAIQLSGMSDENGDRRLNLDTTQHSRRTDCGYTMLNQWTMVSPTSYVKDLQLRECRYLMPYNQCLGIGTKWCCVHTLSTRYVTVQFYSISPC